jgi:hypothetical protein
MAKWMLGRVIALVTALGLPFAGASAQGINTRTFATEDEARAYLRDNPTGPLAKAAFLALVEFRLIRENPGLTRDQIIAAFNQTAVGSAGQRQRSVAIY